MVLLILIKNCYFAKNSIMTFRELHKTDKPLLITNVWDVPSAQIAEKLNFKSIATSSIAIATLLGYRDGEEITFSELEYFVKRIAANTKLPLSVDFEAGYSRISSEIVNHLKRLADIGVVGVNLEDSIFDNSRIIQDADVFSKTLSEVKEQLVKNNIDIFINVRTDAYLLGLSNPTSETKKRIALYENAGADGIFTPCITQVADIKEIVNSTDLPVNVMSMPELPDFDTLTELGVKRISMGGFIFNKMYSDFEESLNAVIAQESFGSIF